MTREELLQLIESAGGLNTARIRASEWEDGRYIVPVAVGNKFFIGKPSVGKEKTLKIDGRWEVYDGSNKIRVAPYEIWFRFSGETQVYYAVTDRAYENDADMLRRDSTAASEHIAIIKYRRMTDQEITL